jgi:hypothetical protein
MKIWVIIFRYRKQDSWQVAKLGRGGLDIKAYGTRKEGKTDLYNERQMHPKGCCKLVPAIIGGELEIEFEV